MFPAQIEMLLSTAWNIILKVLKIKLWKTQTLEQNVKKCFTFQPNNSSVKRVEDECIEAFHLGVWIINPRSWVRFYFLMLFFLKTKSVFKRLFHQTFLSGMHGLFNELLLFLCVSFFLSLFQCQEFLD
jgi:hypothetical protein